MDVIIRLFILVMASYQRMLNLLIVSKRRSLNSLVHQVMLCDPWDQRGKDRIIFNMEKMAYKDKWL